MNKKQEKVVDVKDTDLVVVDENEKVIAVDNSQALTLFTDDGSEYVMALTGERKISYSSIDKDKLSFEEKAKFFNLVNADAELIKKAVNTSINLKDIYMEVVTVEDLLTKQPKQLPRIVLISDEGKSYTCSSPTFLKKLASLISEVGQPMYWEKPIPITFKTVPTKAGFEALTFVTSF